MKKIVGSLIAGFLLLFLVINVVAMRVDKMAKNLEAIEFEQKDQVQTWLKSYTEENTNGYNLSMALLVAAYLGDVSQYANVLQKMQTAIINQNLPDWGKVDGSFDLFNAWMHGRMLVAAKVADTESPVGVKVSLTEELNNFKQNPSNNELGKAFVAWAWSYYALTLEEEASKVANQEAVDIAKQLSGSNQIWAWVMVAQAAGHAKDQERFDQAMKGLGLDQPNGVQALFDKFPANDYRAWGFAALRAAARDMGNSTWLDALEAPTQQAIAASTIEPDKMLAIVYNELASTPTRRNSLRAK